jgi:hypothetical protein
MGDAQNVSNAPHGHSIDIQLHGVTARRLVVPVGLRFWGVFAVTGFAEIPLAATRVIPNFWLPVDPGAVRILHAPIPPHTRLFCHSLDTKIRLWWTFLYGTLKDGCERWHTRRTCMAIPALVNGLLPPGVYTATLLEVWHAFDQPGSTVRPGLNLALQHAVTIIWSRDPAALVYVNGSYVTAKPNPGDVDVAVRSDVWDDDTFEAAFMAAYSHEVLLIDYFFNETTSPQHMEDLFQTVYGSQVRKGIILLQP